MNFGDETFITPPPAGRGIVERAHGGGDRARGRGLRRRPRRQRRALARAGSDRAAAADQPRLRRSRRHRRQPRGAGGDAAAAARRRRSGPSPASAATTSGCSALALLRGAPGIRTGLEDVAYISRGVHAPSNAALVEAAVDLARTLGPRGRDAVAGPGAARAWLSRPRSPWPTGAPPRRRGAARADARGDPRRRGRALLEARLPRDLDAGPGCRGGGAAGRDLPLVPNKEAILIQLQDDFMEQLTVRVVAAIDAPGAPALKLAAAVREHVVYPRAAPQRGIRHRQRDPRPHRGATPRPDRQARRLPGDVRRDDPRRNPRRLAAHVRGARRHLRDPPAMHGGRALVRPGRAARARGGRRAPRRARARLAAGVAPG